MFKPKYKGPNIRWKGFTCGEREYKTLFGCIWDQHREYDDRRFPSLSDNPLDWALTQLDALSHVVPIYIDALRNSVDELRLRGNLFYRDCLFKDVREISETASSQK